MGDLSHIYRDPLFGIAILIAIIAFAILTDYYRSFYKKRKKEKSLNALVKSYEHNGLFDGIAEFLKVSKDPIPTLLFLAKGHSQSGDNQQAIKLYLTLLTQIEDPSQKLEILESLGETYFKAGFLQKAKEIFLEVLSNNPRSIKALFKIIELYETLGEYQNALDALHCLEENVENPSSKEEEKLLLLQDYLQTLKLLQDHQQAEQEKHRALLRILSKQPKLSRIILTYFKTTHLPTFWESLPYQEWQNHIDLLWDFQVEQIPQKIISNSPAIEVFQAKDYYPSKGCSNFALEMYRLFSQYSAIKIQLGFAYRCKDCFGEFPFDNFRCPSCGELGMMDLVLKPQKMRNEKNFSLL
ncbi:tetratricopeptide repeat protein [Helicobacter pametensis]|uniref:tetratricopeptide repeat protein n=1 Tax=Helicobacter pametensis TaxID=95149 RepID=UPI0004B54063|nr:tetratricopeptide repeat protein [Helicobacter pametensis]